MGKSSEVNEVPDFLKDSRPVADSISATLAARGQRYGAFSGHAAVTQGIKFAMASGKNWGCLRAYQKEALEMIAHKIGRILNGDPDYADSWHDIAGYSRLVEDELLLRSEAARP